MSRGLGIRGIRAAIRRLEPRWPSGGYLDRDDVLRIIDGSTPEKPRPDGSYGWPIGRRTRRADQPEPR